MGGGRKQKDSRDVNAARVLASALCIVIIALLFFPIKKRQECHKKREKLPLYLKALPC